MNESWQLKLLYDGQCPMCRWEVNCLRRWNRAGRLMFEDISAPGFNATRYGLTQGQVMGVMHGIFPDGRSVTRMEAFRQAYQIIGLGWLLTPTRWPLLRGLADWGYERFASNRVAIGRWFCRERCDLGHCDVLAGKK